MRAKTSRRSQVDNDLVRPNPKIAELIITDDERRTGLQLRLVLELSIAGLIGKPTAGTQISDANCPVELPSNAG